MTDFDALRSAPDGDDYLTAVDALANALVRVWKACDTDRAETADGVRVGSNLPEALSCALGLAAVALDLDTDEAGTPTDGAESLDRAGDGLVRHRPGSWEAAPVRQLVFSPDLVRPSAAS